MLSTRQRFGQSDEPLDAGTCGDVEQRAHRLSTTGSATPSSDHMTNDRAVLATINDLADEEHRLLRLESDRAATDDDRQRIVEINLELDRCWDLLRQRRARRRAGQDPEQASVRSESTVEKYRQ